MGWMIGVLGFDSWRGLGIFFFTTVSRMALGPTQPPIQWVPGALSLVVTRPGREADGSHPSSAEVNEWVELYLHSPNTPSWCGAQLKHRDSFTFLLVILWEPTIFRMFITTVVARTKDTWFNYNLNGTKEQYMSLVTMWITYKLVAAFANRCWEWSCPNQMLGMLVQTTEHLNI
jgi:hypothetical protein